MYCFVFFLSLLLNYVNNFFEISNLVACKMMNRHLASNHCVVPCKKVANIILKGFQLLATI